ncbi:MAG: mechanosensitive ion channel family protein [Clostridia bacterium]|nr:mechanosensitive ion channel family protein [Clostridia bacterium]
MLDILKNFVNTYLVDFAVRLVCAALVLFIGLKIAKFAVRKITGIKRLSKLDPNVQALVGNSAKFIFYAIVILTAVQVLGIPSATVVAVLGSCGLALGLALQGGLSNIAGGITIMLTRPFHVGDYIETAQGEGFVRDIGVFYTRLNSYDNRDITIPNSVLANTTVNNHFCNGTRRIDLFVPVPYSADLTLAKKVILACAEKSELVLKDPAASANVAKQGDSSIEIKLCAWVNCDNYWAALFELTEETKRALEQFGMEIPFNQLDVHIKND